MYKVKKKIDDDIKDLEDALRLETLAISSVSKGLDLKAWEYVTPAFIFDFITNYINIKSFYEEDDGVKIADQNDFDNF